MNSKDYRHRGGGLSVVEQKELENQSLNSPKDWWRRGKLHSGCKQLTSLIIDYRQMCRAPKVGHNVYWL